MVITGSFGLLVSLPYGLKCLEETKAYKGSRVDVSKQVREFMWRKTYADKLGSFAYDDLRCALMAFYTGLKFSSQVGYMTWTNKNKAQSCSWFCSISSLQCVNIGYTRISGWILKTGHSKAIGELLSGVISINSKRKEIWSLVKSENWFDWLSSFALED